MKTDKFLDFVQSCAEENGKLFILDAGEGRSIDFDGMDCEDLSGWLISPDMHDEFNATDQKDRFVGTFGDCYVFALWRIEDGKMTIEFKPADSYMS